MANRRSGSSAGSVEGINPQVESYIREQIKSANSNVKGMLEHAKTLDASLADHSVPKFNAAVYRKIRRVMESAGELPESALTTSTPRKRSTGQRRRYLDTTSFREMLISFAKSRAGGDGGEQDMFTLYAQFDPRAAKFRDALEGFAREVDAVEGKAGMFDIITTVEERAEEVAKLFA